jgi:lysophospholipase L1-like esterase
MKSLMLLRVFSFTTVFVISAFSSANAQAQEYIMGSLGDSITTGFNSRGLGDHRNLSWSGGTDTAVLSHLRRLQDLLQRPVTGYNFAKVGARAENLFGQLSQLQEHNPSYVTVAIGANDICSWSDEYSEKLSLFERDVRIVLNQLVERRPDILIVLSPIPDMYNLWEIAHARSGCQSKWNLFGICSSLLGSSRTELQRQAFVGRWEAANDVLAHLADEFADNVKFNGELAHTRFEWEQVSTTDCFHPSVAGQNMLAEKTWDTSLFVSSDN